MPRPPDKDAKTARLVILPKQGQEDSVRWVKQWAAKNGKTLNDVFWPAVEALKKAHGYPDGHSQTSLDFAGLPKMLPRHLTCIFGSPIYDRGEFVCREPDYHGYKISMACDYCGRYQLK